MAVIHFVYPFASWWTSGENPPIAFDSPKTKLQSSLSLHGALVPGPPADTEIRRDSGPLYEMAQDNAYGQHHTAVDSKPQVKNTVFDPQLVESLYVKHGDTEGWLCIY